MGFFCFVFCCRKTDLTKLYKLLQTLGLPTPPTSSFPVIEYIRIAGTTPSSRQMFILFVYLFRFIKTWAGDREGKHMSAVHLCGSQRTALQNWLFLSQVQVIRCQQVPPPTKPCHAQREHSGSGTLLPSNFWLGNCSGMSSRYLDLGQPPLTSI